MSNNMEKVNEGEEPFGRYSVYEADDGGIVIYDTQENTAWVKSEDTVSLSEMY